MTPEEQPIALLSRVHRHDLNTVESVSIYASLAFLFRDAKKAIHRSNLSVSQRPALLEASGRRRTSRPLQVDRVLSFKLQRFKS
jgi:hypothetical protein